MKKVYKGKIFFKMHNQIRCEFRTYCQRFKKENYFHLHFHNYIIYSYSQEHTDE